MWAFRSTGDYSDAQLMRANRQALALRKYYEILSEAISSHQLEGKPYLVHSIASMAGRILGGDAVGGSTVRLWHTDYTNNNGKLSPDGRGHYTRELLIMEEDIHRKFVKWSLMKAKADDLSVESARDFLNLQLLNTLEV